MLPEGHLKTLRFLKQLYIKSIYGCNLYFSGMSHCVKIQFILPLKILMKRW